MYVYYHFFLFQRVIHMYERVYMDRWLLGNKNEKKIINLNLFKQNI
jgi:hypothetical protein